MTKLKITNNVVDNSQQVPDWKRANMEGIKEYLNVDWKTNFEGKDTFQCWDTFKQTLHSAINDNVPMKKRRVKSEKKVWMTRYIVRQIRKKKQSYS